jgi:A118 family predicted phage portal protein
MFQRILAWIKEVLGKMLSTSNVKQALHVDIAITSEMTNAINTWALMYQNKSPWLSSDIKSLNLAAAVAAEIARAVTIEMGVQVTGSPRADFLAQQMVPVLNNIRTYTEYCAAKGGLMFKPYIRENVIAVDYVQGDQFYPVAFDVNGNMTSCVFGDQKQIGNIYFTRLEYHALTAEGYLIKNAAWRSTARDTLGNQVPLDSVADWADLEPEATIMNIDKPLFAYFKMPFANNIDPTSPLGVSVYSRAVELIRQADEQWSNFLWEFESGQRALYTDPLAFGKDSNNKPILPNRRLYRTLDLVGKIDAPGLFEDWTPTLRETNILNGLDAILKRIEFTVGLAQGTISNPETVVLTATEIKMSKQRTYATITDTQKALQGALDQLLYAMDVWATIGNLAPRGKYQAVYTFDDSIVADHDTQFAQDSQALGMQVMSKVEFRMRNYGETEDVAKQMIAMIGAENTNDTFFPSE